MLVRRRLEGIRALVSTAAEDDGFLVAFTERAGGVSDAPFASLNLGFGAGDEPARVLENRRRLCSALRIEPFACSRQVHGAKQTRIGRRRAGQGFAGPDESAARADSLVTSLRRVALAVLTADCVPIAVVDPRRARLAVVHAGWRGIAAGIVGSALRPFPDRRGIRAVIGPSIAQHHYEVGEDVAAAVASALETRAPVARMRGRAHLDLPGAVEHALRECGVRRIERADECTACETDRFFSYRRDGRTGRQALVAVRW